MLHTGARRRRSGGEDGANRGSRRGNRTVQALVVREELLERIRPTSGFCQSELFQMANLVGRGRVEDVNERHVRVSVSS